MSTIRACARLEKIRAPAAAGHVRSAPPYWIGAFRVGLRDPETDRFRATLLWGGAANFDPRPPVGCIGKQSFAQHERRGAIHRRSGDGGLQLIPKTDKPVSSNAAGFDVALLTRSTLGTRKHFIGAGHDLHIQRVLIRRNAASTVRPVQQRRSRSRPCGPTARAVNSPWPRRVARTECRRRAW